MLAMVLSLVVLIGYPVVMRKFFPPPPPPQDELIIPELPRPTEKQLQANATGKQAVAPGPVPAPVSAGAVARNCDYDSILACELIKSRRCRNVVDNASL